MGHLVQICSHATDLFNELGKGLADFFQYGNFIRWSNGSTTNCADDKCLLCQTGLFDFVPEIGLLRFIHSYGDYSVSFALYFTHL
jgi:hypothetical protein